MKKLLKSSVCLLLSFMLCFSALSSTSIAMSTFKSNTDQSQVSKTTTRSGNYIYYSVFNKLYKVNVKTKKKYLVYKYSVDYSPIYDISVYKGYVYFVLDKSDSNKESFPYIYRIKTNGKDLKYLAKGENPVPYYDKVYYEKIDFDTNNTSSYKEKGIYKMNLTGTSKTCIKSSSSIYDFKIYKSHIYYSHYPNSHVYSVTTSGKSTTKVVPFNCIFEDIYKGDIYFVTTSVGNSNFYKFNISSKKVSKVSNYTGYIMGVKNGYMYYVHTSSNDRYLYKLKLSNNKKTLIAKGDAIEYILVEGDYLLYEDSLFTTNPKTGYNNYIYLVKTSGADKTLLEKYFAV